MESALIRTAALATAVADRSALTWAAEVASLASETRATLPLLTCLRLRGDGSALFLTGTNLDLSIDVRVAAAADPHLDVAVPGKLLRDILRGGPKAADMVAFTTPPVIEGTEVRSGTTIPAAVFGGSERVLIDFATVKFQLAPLMTTSWPDLKGPTADAPGFRAFALPTADLFAALDSVAFAISNEETRYYLNGVYMHAVDLGQDGSELRFVTTDGHRMARQSIPVPVGAEGLPGVLLHKATVYLLLKLLKPAKGKQLPDAVTIEVSDRMVRFMFGDVTITAKQIEGTFPDYERVTPKGNDKLATFSLAALREAIDTVSIIATERGGKAVGLSIADGQCTVTVRHPEHGTSEASVAVEYDSPKPGTFEIGFNTSYLLAIIDELRASGDKLTLAFSDMGGPALVTGDREGWLGVLMPMRV